ncbi:MAG: hypothetical protein ACXAC7_12795 [Candidatus Hodarchaeales archaeon]|jgi:uncharacterized membrane protein YagU involved in acid resistance
MTTTTVKGLNISENYFSLIISSLIGGITGGLAFGIFMYIVTLDTSFFVLVSGLVDASDALIGFSVHMGISVFFGLLFGLIMLFIPKFKDNLALTLSLGLVWGILLWIVAAGIAMPLLMDMPLDFVTNNLFKLDYWTSEGKIRSFVGHLFFGGFLALEVYFLPTKLKS